MAKVRIRTLLASMAAAGMATGPATASTAEPAARSGLIEKLLDCRAIAEDSGRLACFDGQAATIATAQKRGDVVVLSKQELKDTRRSLFGFILPKFNLRGLRMDEPDIDRVEAKVSAARSIGYYWSVSLDGDAGTWETTEAIDVRPKPGDKAKIKKGMMGGFLGTIGNSNLVRMRRVL